MTRADASSPEGRRAWPMVLAWTALIAGVVGMFANQRYELLRERAIIVRKERLIRSVMLHYGWEPDQIEAIASGQIDPYGPEARPRRPVGAEIDSDQGDAGARGP